MNEINSHAGINISLSKLQLLEVAREGEKFQIINVNESLFDEPLNLESQKETFFSAQLQSAFDQIRIKKNLKSSYVSFSLPQEIFFTAELPFDNSLLCQDLIEEFKWEFSLLYPFIPAEDMVLQYYEMEKNPLNTKSTALVLLIEKKFIRLIKEFCMKNELSLRYIDSAMLSANNLINSLSHHFSESYVLNVFLSEKTVAVIVNLNGNPAHLKILQRTGKEQTADLISNILNTAQLKPIKTGLLNEAYISGSGVSAELISQVRLTTGLTFRQFNPFTSLQVKSGIENSHLLKENYSSFISAAGMAFRLA